MKSEYKRIVTQASDDMLARWIIKNMLSQQDSVEESNAQFLAAMLREVRRQCAVPEGGVTVPAVPTDAMLEAGANTGCFIVSDEDCREWIWRQHAATVWEAMLRASLPQAER